MGEYYKWVNPERKEYIDPSYFDYGSKSHESVHKDNSVIKAVYDLLSNEWKNCKILWLGDECRIPSDVATELFNILKTHCDEIGYPDDMIDTICESYHNVSGLFKDAEKITTEEIGYFIEDYNNGLKNFNEFGINFDNPFEGLFQREGKTFNYIINYSKQIAYNFDKTKILNLNGEENDFADPLPVLLGYGRSMNPGIWLGDLVGVADEVDYSIKVLETISLDW